MQLELEVQQVLLVHKVLEVLRVQQVQKVQQVHKVQYVLNLLPMLLRLLMEELIWTLVVLMLMVKNKMKDNKGDNPLLSF